MNRIALILCAALAQEATTMPHLTPSDDLVELPELDDPDVSLVLTPASYVSWAAMLSANPTVTDFLLTSGNYVSWGTFAPATGGTISRRRVLRYVDAGVQPTDRAEEARIDRFAVTGDYWILHGLTTRAHSAENTLDSTTGSVVDMVLIEDGTAAYGIRVRLGSIDCAVQRSTIRNAQGALRGDAIGVQIRVNAPDPTLRTRVVDCQIYNYGDSVQGTAAPNPDELLGIDGTIVDNNDFYTTSDYYTSNGLGITENAIDMKAGSADANSPIRISNNRMHGYRRSDPAGGASGSDGTALVIQNFCRNVVVENNVIWNCAAGIREEIWASGPQVSRNVVYRGNVIHGTEAFNVADHGHALDVRLTETFEGNAFVHCQTLAWQDVLAGQSPHSMVDNVVVDTPLGEYTEGWDNGNTEMGERHAGPLRIWTARITGPELVVLSHGGALMTPTTTLGAIRENMEAIMVALTPLTRDDKLFQRHRGDIDFRQWAEGNPATCLRWFQIKRVDPISPPQSSDMQVRVRTAKLEIAVAYPRHWASVGGAEEPDLGPIEDVIEQDQELLDSRHGVGLDAYALYVAGQHRSRIEWQPLELLGGKVLLCVGNAEVTYYEEV